MSWIQLYMYFVYNLNLLPFNLDEYNCYNIYKKGNNFINNV